MRLIYEDEDIEVFVESCTDITSGVFIHTNVKQWSLSKYKKFLVVWGCIMTRMRSEGWKHLFAVPPSPSEEKWEMLFGFKDSGLEVSGYKLMILEL